VQHAVIEAHLLDADRRLFHQGSKVVAANGRAVFIFGVHCWMRS